jgi:signal transduction histidine kinase/ActR/RegA family two-component response regulator
MLKLDLEAGEALARRVLVVMPTERDAQRTSALLRETGINGTHCPDLGTLLREIARGAGAILVTDDFVAGESSHELARTLREQPPWSRVPVVIVAHEGSNRFKAIAAESFPSAVVVERPVRIRTLISVLHSALRAREDQYQIRDALLALQRSEKELAAQAEQLRATDRRKDEFLATLAHELRNPLAPLQTGLDILQGSARDRASDQALRVMGRQLKHMVRLIDDLLDVSRITQGKLELKRAPVTLSDVLDAAVETSRPLIQRSHHVLRVTVDAGPVVLDADATRLAQVVSNLLNNASKYTPDGGNIELSARRDGGRCVIQVRDDGIGIPPQELGDVFQMFSQVNAGFERSQGGMGIGLALAKSLVELHGGAISVESPGVGLGSTFTVSLPLSSSAAEPLPPADAGGAAEPFKRRILIVDDNYDAADMLAVMLDLAGYETKKAHDGATAIASAKAWTPNVVILDIGLPDVTGYDVARRLREDASLVDTELIALSGWGTDDDKRKATAAGFDRHFTKPVNAAVLYAALAGDRKRDGKARGPAAR